LSKESDELRIFEDLSNPIRLEILSSLRSEPLKTTQIAKKLKTSIQALQRHVNRLVESKLIEKNSDGEIALSPIGEITLQQVPAFQFLSKYAKYFSTHTFDGIPNQLLLRIAELNNSEFIGDTMKGWQRARDIAVNGKEFLYSVTITMPVEFFDVAKGNLPKGAQYKIVYGKNTYVPKGYYNYPARNSWAKAQKKSQVEERFVKHVPITVVISENEAHVQFENKKIGEPDTIGIFVSKDDLFRQWCLDLFGYYWNEVPKIEKFKLQER